MKTRGRECGPLFICRSNASEYQNLFCPVPLSRIAVAQTSSDTDCQFAASVFIPAPSGNLELRCPKAALGNMPISSHYSTSFSSKRKSNVQIEGCALCPVAPRFLSNIDFVEPLSIRVEILVGMPVVIEFHVDLSKHEKVYAKSPNYHPENKHDIKHSSTRIERG